METIVALATPAGNSGVAVIRISGDNAKSILQKIIREDLDFEPRKMYLKNVYTSNLVDKCLVVYFASPNSFTGEDVAEIQSHGGYFLAQQIIKECISLGCNMATAGEFSKRAFINGKMSIDQAEGIMDLINAESDAQAKVGSTLMQGKLKEKIQQYQNNLTDMLAEIEAKLDYPEYEYTSDESSDIKEKLKDLISSLDGLISDSQNGLIIKNGVKVAIVGAPNVGKSSLLNALTKSNKAIVTDIAGTTRDIVEAEYEYKGIIFRLFDTAGIHDSDDIVEKIGIDRALSTLENVDIVLRVSTPDTTCNVETDKPYINVFNKSDLLTSKSNQDYFFISAINNENIDALKEEIFNQTVKEGIQSDKLYLTNTRHIDCVKFASSALKNILDIFDSTTMDIVSSELKSAWSILGEISGITSDEAIIDKIFSKFCLGK
ncbi:MAG: tRNA uridine-5-carboxymethylaminomethyl(34) synthesis GTPase MnmE [Clostridiales bacterium]|nr:tRNA uridine-5-carboxymethylaminomethyl(34) synthesis GTPase MnmE [Clostridiales bacterium]